jgi:hypothetical protein
MVKDKIKMILDNVKATDLDGTLAYQYPPPYKGSTNIGPAVPKHLARVKKWLAAGDTVKVFTARAHLPGFKEALRKWLKANGLPEDLEITNVKDLKTDEFWDDRARRVGFNTGEKIG